MTADLRTFSADREGEPLALAEERVSARYPARPAASLDAYSPGEALPWGVHMMDGGVAAIEVFGPLDQRAWLFFDGYDQVVSRTRAALSHPDVRAGILLFDSPGGVVAGNLDAARAIRAAADLADKPLVAHAETWATSAAYALACACDHVSVTHDGALGSIGVIATVYDRTKATASEGLDVRVVRSGALKADPHPDVALTDASVTRVRARVTELAQSFAAWVSERRGRSTDELLALQGATVYAPKALEAGLADSIGTLDAAVSTALALADERTTRRKQQMTEINARARLDALRSALAVETDDELTAAVATLQKRAGQHDAATARVADLERQLAERDARDRATAREAVLAKHRQRGALTPAMEGDADYLADLAPLAPDALDRVLSKLVGVSPAATPRPVGAVDPVTVTPEAAEIDETTRALAEAVGVSEDAVKRAMRS